jgi:NTP pyrophosphatase (non-canonical NTP hydrolase)
MYSIEDIYKEKITLFSRAMLEKLNENSNKGSWESCELDYLFCRLQEEVRELQHAVYENSSPLDAIRREAADVANFVMMIADNCGALPFDR